MLINLKISVDVFSAWDLDFELSTKYGVALKIAISNLDTKTKERFRI